MATVGVGIYLLGKCYPPHATDLDNALSSHHKLRWAWSAALACAGALDVHKPPYLHILPIALSVLFGFAPQLKLRCTKMLLWWIISLPLTEAGLLYYTTSSSLGASQHNAALLLAILSVRCVGGICALLLFHHYIRYHPRRNPAHATTTAVYRAFLAMLFTIGECKTPLGDAGGVSFLIGW